MDRRLIAAAWFAVLLPGCLTTSGTAERPLVTSFEIQGVNAISSDDLRERLATQESSHFLFFSEDLHYYDADALSNDVKRIERYYQSQGYYRARVIHVETQPSGPGRIQVLIQVEEGEPVRVEEVRLEGLESAPEIKVPELPIRPGLIFTEEQFDAGKTRLAEVFHNSGYARAEVAQHTDINSARTAAVVTYTVKPGDRYRFGNVFVAGSVDVPRARIRQEAESAVQPGAVFDESLLATAQRRVFDLGVFGGVRVTQGPPDPDNRTIPVVVVVREAPFHTIRIGPGVAYEASRFDALVSGSWADRNFLSGLRKLTIDGRVGYSVLFSPGTREDGFVGAITADFTQPAIIARPIDLNVRLGVERGLEPAYFYWAERIRLGLPVRLGRMWTLIPSYNLEIYQLQPNPLPPEVSTASLFFQGCASTDACILSYFEQQIIWDGRDDPIETHSGAYLSLAVQEGFSIAGVGFSYLRLIPEARGFLPLGRRSVLAARLRFGFLEPLTGRTVPIVARFNGGGPNSMRGYYIGRLSPILKDTTLPIGGQSELEASLELRFPLSQSLQAAVFLDAGNVGLEAEDALDLGQLQYAVGFGLRYLTGFGPVRVDLAANLPKYEGGRWVRTGVPVVSVDNEGRLKDTAIIHHEPIIGFHLSIGEAF